VRRAEVKTESCLRGLVNRDGRPVLLDFGIALLMLLPYKKLLLGVVIS